ncbi:hypothetical protein PINS_up012022 [Pythium insidiosum]|nr:hypothetical protein PINS_up012022 [Pythium insidiosum]
MATTRAVTAWTHVRTLLWKNWLMKRRHYVATTLEVVLPVLFIVLMSALQTLTHNVTVPAGWSSTDTAPGSKTQGQSYALTDPSSNFGTWNLNLDFAFPAPAGRYLVSEATMSGLLLYLGMKAGDELRNTDTVSRDDQARCRNAVAFFGAVSTDWSSANAIPSSCRDVVTPYKIAIAPDNAFTRKYFFETMKAWYPQGAGHGLQGPADQRGHDPGVRGQCRLLRDGESAGGLHHTPRLRENRRQPQGLRRDRVRQVPGRRIHRHVRVDRVLASPELDAGKRWRARRRATARWGIRRSSRRSSGRSRPNSTPSTRSSGS